MSVAASELCLAQLDFPLYCVFKFPRLLFYRVYLRLSYVKDFAALYVW